MANLDWTVPVEADGSWLCEHNDRAGNPAPPTRLNLEAGWVENPDALPKKRRRALRCPDCGTRWRAWDGERVARYYVEWVPREPSPSYVRAKPRDIDRLIAAVRAALPGLKVTQHQQYWPADDDGVWWFWAPGRDVHVESTYGMCPFLLETDDLWGKTAPTAGTFDEAVALIIRHLRG